MATKGKVETTVETEVEGSASTESIMIAVPKEITVLIGGSKKQKVAGVPKVLDFGKIPAEHRSGVAEYLLLAGLKIRLDNKFSVIEGTRQVKMDATDERLAEFHTGIFRRTAGGNTLTPKVEAWIEWLEAKGHKVSSRTLRGQQMGLCAASLVNQGKATTEESMAMAETELESWVARMEENNVNLKKIIDAKMALAGGEEMEVEFMG